MLPPLGPGLESRLRACAAGMLLPAVLGAGMVLAGTAFGAGQGDPPPTDETAPPAQTSPPPTTPDDPPEPESKTITLIVPAAPAAKPKRAPAKQPSAPAPAPAAAEEKAAPRSAARSREYDRSPPTRSYEEPAAPQATPKPTSKPKPTRKPARRAKQPSAVVAEPVTLWYAAAVRDSTRGGAVLGEQYPPQAFAEPTSDRDLYLLILLVCVVVCIVVAWATVNLLGEPPPG